nr:NADH dehydrogenase subunit 4L [Micraspides sp.]
MMELKLIFVFPLVMCMNSFIMFVSKRSHLLHTLLSLEFIMLSIFWFLNIFLVEVSSELYFGLFFLTLVACEGALGLSLLVVVVRSHGNDYFDSLNILQC